MPMSSANVRQPSNPDNPESVSVALAAIEWDVALVDNDVRKLLGVMNGTSDETYAGRSSATPEGRAFLQHQIDGLMKEKAQLKEKKTLLLQRQQGSRLGDGGGGAMADESAGLASHHSQHEQHQQQVAEQKVDPSAPKSPSTRRRPSFPLGTRPPPGAGGGSAADVKGSTEMEDRKAVAATTALWKDTVTSGTYDAPKRAAALYAADATLWGTVSEEVRDTPQQIYAYFDYFARLPELRVVEFTPVAVRVYGDFAVQAGTYTFAWRGEDGHTVEKRARFSFTFRRDNPGSPNAWTIVEHHSSSMPNAPIKGAGVSAGVPMGQKYMKRIITPDQRAVAKAAVFWKDTVTSGKSDTPRRTAALYAEDATLWGTVSEEVRDSPEQIYAYFDYFARLPELRVVEYTPVAVRVYGDFAVQAGTYTFAWKGDLGDTVQKRARFSFTFRRAGRGSPQPWMIVEHHSSSMPSSPIGIQPVAASANPANPARTLADTREAASKPAAPRSSSSRPAGPVPRREEPVPSGPLRGGGRGRGAGGVERAGVDYLRFPAGAEGEEENRSPAASTDSILKQYIPQRSTCLAVGAVLAVLVLLGLGAAVVAPALWPADPEAPAPIRTTAVVNVAAAIGAAVATGLAPVGGALSRM